MTWAPSLCQLNPSLRALIPTCLQENKPLDGEIEEYLSIFAQLHMYTRILPFLPPFFLSPLCISGEGESKIQKKHPVVPPFCAWTERNQAPGGGSIPDSTSIRSFRWPYQCPRHNGNCRWLLVIYRAGVTVGKSRACAGLLGLEAGAG